MFGGNPMTLLTAGLVLLAALMHAGWNTVLKLGQGERALTMAGVVGTATVIGALIVPFVDVPARESWPWLAASIAIHVAYFILLNQAYRFGDLSHVYPVARGTGPLLAAAAAAWIANETLSDAAFWGVILVSGGILSLSFQKREDGAGGNLAALGFALLTGVTIAAYTVADALGIRASGARLGYIAWLMLLNGLPFLAWVWWKHRGELAGYLRHRAGPAVLGGAMTFSAYGLVLWAYSLGAIAPVAALRETSVIIAVLIGTLFLGEPFGRRRLLAAVIVAAGAALLALG